LNVLFLLLIEGLLLSGTVDTTVSTDADYTKCGAYLEQSGFFEVDEMVPVCHELISTGEYRDPDFQDRGLIIYWVQLGDTLKMELKR